MILKQFPNIIPSVPFRINSPIKEKVQDDVSDAQSIDEDMESQIFSPDEKQYNQRIIFARKVYWMILIQMIIVGSIILLVKNYKGMQKYVQQHPHLELMAFIGVVVFSILPFCFRYQFQVFPLNYTIFILFTSSVSLLVVSLITFHDSLTTLLVFSSLFSIILCLLIYSMTVKSRMTYQGSTIFLSLSLLTVFEIFTIFTDIGILQLMFTSILSIILAYLLIYDIHADINNKQESDQYNEDFVMCSVAIYWDLILNLLRVAELIVNFLAKDRN